MSKQKLHRSEYQLITEMHVMYQAYTYTAWHQVINYDQFH